MCCPVSSPHFRAVLKRQRKAPAAGNTGRYCQGRQRRGGASGPLPKGASPAARGRVALLGTGAVNYRRPAPTHPPRGPRCEAANFGESTLGACAAGIHGCKSALLPQALDSKKSPGYSLLALIKPSPHECGSDIDFLDVDGAAGNSPTQTIAQFLFNGKLP